MLLKDRFKRNGRIIKYNIKSSIWCGIKDTHDIVLENCIWCIGNGRKSNFWLDNWTWDILASKYQIPGTYHHSLTSKVSDWWHGSWQISSNIQMAIPSLIGIISNFSVSNAEDSDFLAWKSVKPGSLTMKDAYKMINNPSPSSFWSSFPWDKDTPPTHSMTAWRF